MWDTIAAPFTGPNQATLYPDGSWDENGEVGSGLINDTNNAIVQWAGAGTAMWKVDATGNSYRIQIGTDLDGWQPGSRIRFVVRHPDSSGVYDLAGRYYVELSPDANAKLYQGAAELYEFPGGAFGHYAANAYELRVRNIQWLAGAAPHVRFDLIDLTAGALIGSYIDDAVNRAVTGAYVGFSILGDAANASTQVTYFQAYTMQDAGVMGGEFAASYGDLPHQPSFAIPEQVRFLGQSWTSEYGYEQRYPRQLQPRKLWRLVWDSLTEAEYQTLRDFFDGCLGGFRPFRWFDIKSQDWNVGAFIESTLNARRAAPGVFICSAQVVEIYDDPDFASMSVPVPLSEIAACHVADYEEYEQFILEAGVNEASAWTDAEALKLVVPPGYYKINFRRGGVSWRTVAGVDEYDCSKIVIVREEIENGGIATYGFPAHSDYPSQREFYASRIGSPLTISTTCQSGGIIAAYLNTGASPTAKDKVLLSVCRKPYPQCVSPLPEVPGATTDAYYPGDFNGPLYGMKFEPIDSWNLNADKGYLGTYEKIVTLSIPDNLAAGYADAGTLVGGVPKGVIYYLPPWSISAIQAHPGPYRFPDGTRTLYRSGKWAIYVRVYDCRLYHKIDAYGQYYYSWKGVHFSTGVDAGGGDDGGEMGGTCNWSNEIDTIMEKVRCEPEPSQPGFWRATGANFALLGAPDTADHPIYTDPDACGIYPYVGIGGNDFWTMRFWIDEAVVADPSRGGEIDLLITACPDGGPAGWPAYVY